MESSHHIGVLTSIAGEHVAGAQPPKLLDQVRARLRRLGLAKQ